MGMRSFLDNKVAPHFHEGGKFEKYYTFYEMFDTMLYTPDRTRSALPPNHYASRRAD